MIDTGTGGGETETENIGFGFEKHGSLRLSDIWFCFVLFCYKVLLTYLPAVVSGSSKGLFFLIHSRT